MTDELLGEFTSEIESWTLIPSEGGRFEFTVDGELLFSKKAEGRHPDVSELRDKLKAVT